MKKVCIVGDGRWAKRLKNKLSLIGISRADLIDSYAKVVDVSKYNEVIICVPAYCLLEVLKKVKWGNGKKIVISCVKGLIDNGETVCKYLNKNLKKNLKFPVLFLGGANIDDGNEIIDVSKDYKLELACVLKNVYAIGFGMALAKGENYASYQLINYLNEYKKLGIKERYRADLFVSCYSDKSRNKMFGKKFASHEKYDEKTVEGLRTAQIIKKKDLFKDCKELRKIVKTICV